LPGDAPAPAPPGNWYADRVYPAAEMDRSRHEMMKENGGQTTGFISLNLAEYQARKGRDGFRWEGEAWYGGDINRLTLKSEGETVLGEGIETVETQVALQPRHRTLFQRAGGHQAGFRTRSRPHLCDGRLRGARALLVRGRGRVFPVEQGRSARPARRLL
jgi:uncharacterized protein involved in copper resistance